MNNYYRYIQIAGFLICIYSMCISIQGYEPLVPLYLAIGLLMLFIDNFFNFSKKSKTPSKKVVYIAHPIGGDVQGNLEKVRKIGRQITLSEPNIIVFAPYYFDCHCLDDAVPEERKRGMQNNAYFFENGFIDELRLYGDRISSGMKEEIKLADKYRIPIRGMTTETRMNSTYRW